MAVAIPADQVSRPSRADAAGTPMVRIFWILPMDLIMLVLRIERL